MPSGTEEKSSVEPTSDSSNAFSVIENKTELTGKPDGQPPRSDQNKRKESPDFSLSDSEESSSDLPIDLKGDWGRKEVRSLTLQEADRLQEEIARIVNEIELQINQAKSKAKREGEYADPDWFWSAQAALKAFRRKRQLVEEVRSDLRRQAKETFDVEKRKREEFWFKKICKKELDEKTYSRISRKASQKVKEEILSPKTDLSKDYPSRDGSSSSHPLVS